MVPKIKVRHAIEVTWVYDVANILRLLVLHNTKKTLELVTNI